MNALVFPGQGVQYQGMGKEIYDTFPLAREIFSYIDNLLGMNISQKCFFSEKEELNDIYIQQLAIMSVCLATYEVFRETGIKIDFLSGLSLGQYFCLYPAGVLNLEDTVYLVKKRAEVTQEVVKKNPSTMLAVIGLQRDHLESLSRLEYFHIASINSPRQIVVAVEKDDSKRIKQLIKSEGAKVVELNTGGGFHSPFMMDAATSLKRYVQRIRFNDAKIPIVGNLIARSLRDADEIKRNIVEQLSCTIFWKDCIEFMVAEGVDTFFGIGPSRVLLSLIKNTVPQVKVINIEKVKDLYKLVALT